MQERKHSLPDPLLAQLSELLAARMGLNFPKERWRDLERAMGAAAKDLGFDGAEACLQWFLASPVTKTQVEILASHLTVGETYFFREPKSFEVAENHILTDLVRSRRGKDQRLRIWSAGCATGEEPYSIAILVDKLIPEIIDWNVTILATDINPRFLQKASEGAYTTWSFRGVPSWVKERCFKIGKSGRFYILPQLQRMVTFSYLNLAEDTYPALTNGTNAMDLIFCRNVLMYLSQPCAKRVIQHLHHCLVEDGWLIVSPVEISHALFSPFVPVSFPGVTLYRKTAEPVRQIPTLELPSEARGFTPIAAFPPQGGRSHFPFPSTGEDNRFPSPSIEEDRLPPPPSMEEDKLSPSPLMGEGRGGGVTAVAENTEEAKPVCTPYDEALALYRKGRYGEAADKISKFLCDQPDATQATELLARALANQGRLAQAREWCEKVIAHDKLNAGAHYLLATIQQECGEVAAASASLKRTLYLDHNFALAHFALGNLARREGKAKESEKHYANALSVLNACRPEDILPESEGMTARRLVEVIQSMTYQNAAA